MRAFHINSLLRIDEGRGIFARAPGEPYVSITDPMNIITFQSIQAFPEVRKGQVLALFDTPDDLNLTLKTVLKSIKNKPVTWSNALGNNKAFAIATFADADGKPLYFGRYFQSIKADMTTAWKAEDFPGYRFATKSGTKGAAAKELMPSKIIGTDKMFSNANTLLTHLMSTITDENILAGLRDLKAGRMPLVFPNSKAQLEVIRDYFCENLHPIALTKKGMVTGDSSLAENSIIPGETYKQCTIQFSTSETEGLYDSFMVSPSGVEFGISSKGGKGANASTKNLHAAIEKGIAAEPKLQKKHSKFIKVINAINDNTSIDAPLRLAVDFNIINEEDIVKITAAINTNKKDTKGLSKYLVDMYKDYMTSPAAQKSVEKPGFSVGLVILTKIAQLVAQEINNDPKDYFNKGATEFLNFSSVIQIYTQAKVVGEDVHVYEFKAIYPPQFEGRVELDPSKNYMSTVRPKGKYTFVFKK
jgi:hypothetical protein